MSLSIVIAKVCMEAHFMFMRKIASAKFCFSLSPFLASLFLSLTLSLLFIPSHSLSLFLSHTCHLLRPKSSILSGPKDPKKFPLSLVLSKSQKTPTVKICQRCVFSRAQLFFFWPFRPFRKINNF